MKGPLSFLPVCRPSIQELNNADIQHIYLTSPHGWDPYDADSFSSIDSVQICNKLAPMTNEICDILQLRQTNKKQAITPEDLVLRWGIGIQTARLTLTSTY